MMRKVFSVALMATLAFVFVQSANAGTTIDVAFQDGVAPTGITIVAGDTAAPGCQFGGYYGGSVSTGRCMDVLVKTTDPLIAIAAWVDYDNDNGLAWSQIDEARNLTSGALMTLVTCVMPDGIMDTGSRIETFGCIVPPPNGPPSLAVGTYKIGTIVWDTSATTVGTETISVVNPIIGAVINGVIVDVSSQVVTGSHILTIVPEPGTASLLGLGFIGLILAGRRSRA